MPILGIIDSQKSGHLWAPAPAYDSIATVTVGSGGSSSITFTSFPSTYTHLQIRGIARDNRSASGLATGGLQFNSDSTYTNYRGHILYGTGSTAAAATSQPSNGTALAFSTNGNSSTANSFAAAVIDILDYANTSKYKTVRTLSGADNNDTTGEIDFVSGVWMSTAAITNITLIPYGSNSFVQYSSFALYGVK